MRSARSALAAIGTVLYLAAPALAEEGPHVPSWIPYAELSVDLSQDDERGEVTATPASVAMFAGNKNHANTPAGFNGRLGLLSPRLSDRFGKPRIFLDAGVYATPESKYTVMEIGDTVNLAELGGSRIQAKQKQPLPLVGLGAEFTLPWIDERIRIRPSAEYQYEKLSLTGRYDFQTSFQDPNDPTKLIRFRWDGEGEISWHQVGVGLEAEFVVWGGLSLFLESRVLWRVSGDDDVTFSGPLFGDPTSTSRVTWRWSREDSQAFSGAFGLRYSYRGF